MTLGNEKTKKPSQLLHQRLAPILPMNSTIILCFLFFGHSNMTGINETGDDSVQGVMWYSSFSSRKFVDTYTGNVCPIAEFLRLAKFRYPQCKVAAISFARGGYSLKRQLEEMSRVEDALKHFPPEIKVVAALSMWGITDAVSDSSVRSFTLYYLQFADALRRIVGNEKLPMILSRFERYNTCIESEHAVNTKYYSSIDKQIDFMPYLDPETMLCPRSYVPAGKGLYYTDCHHYNRAGSNMWAHDAIDLLQNVK